MLSTRNVEILRLHWMAARYKERVGERIKAAREAKHWSQGRLAREMPGTLDGASISRWETGRVEPRADNLQALADALEVDPSYFLVPEPEPGTGDLMGALSDGDQSQLDRIEAMLTELLGFARRTATDDLRTPPGALGRDAQGLPPTLPHPEQDDSAQERDARSDTGEA